MSVRDRATALHSSVPTQVLASKGVKTMWFRGDITCRQHTGVKYAPVTSRGTFQFSSVNGAIFKNHQKRQSTAQVLAKKVDHAVEAEQTV